MSKKLKDKMKKKKWKAWTLQFPNGELDMDFDMCFHLFSSKKKAKEYSGYFEEPLPKPVKVIIKVIK